MMIHTLARIIVIIFYFSNAKAYFKNVSN